MDPLEGLPIAVLLALQEAMGDPSDKGRARARKRAEDAGFHLSVNGAEGLVLLPARFDPEPIPMEEAEEGVESVQLRFDR